MRNRIVHGYSGVDLNIVWNTIQEDLPVLKDEIAAYCLKHSIGRENLEFSA